VESGEGARGSSGPVRPVESFSNDREEAPSASHHLCFLCPRTGTASEEVPAALATEFSAQVYAMDANLAVPALMPLADRFARAYSFERNMTTVFIVFASVALLLAVVGLYAIVAHSVKTRTREIGIRRAMGATTWQMRDLVLRQAALPLAAGLTTGVSVSVALAPVLEPILVRVSAADPATLGAASLALTVSAIAGCLLPARHALQIDPAIVLRHE